MTAPDLTAPPVCCICAGPVEPWPHDNGWGNIPDPLCECQGDDAVCCRDCDRRYVQPARALTP